MDFSKSAAKPKKSFRSMAEERKRTRDKERAGKMFSKQFAGSTSSDASERGPRAAVYKGEMGRSHRKATRMQTSGAGARSFAPGFSLAFIPEAIGHFSRKAVIGVFAVVCVVVACVSLYAPAKQYYLAVRDTARLEAEYAAVQDRNAAIAEENETLATDAGAETELRERYSYVKSGEDTANVSGLSDAAAKDNAADSVTGIVAAGTVKAPDTWYSSVLDKVFGYTG